MLIRLKNVEKTYRSGEVETKALRDVSLDIKQSEFVVVLGPSGSGKTTLLNVISGLDRIDAGHIFFQDTELSCLSDDKLTEFRRRHLGFVFQQYNLLQNLTAFENVQIGADIGEHPLDVEETLRKVGLTNHQDKYPYQLSGGEQQRVSIARSIAKNPDILFCDELTGALDEKTARQVLRVVEELNRDLGLTMVVITHNAGIAAMADRVIRMNSGQIESITKNDTKQLSQDIQWG